MLLRISSGDLGVERMRERVADTLKAEGRRTA
jgi:hypothetical protein